MGLKLSVMKMPEKGTIRNRALLVGLHSSRDFFRQRQNHSLRYATHHAMNKIGMVAPRAHHSGRMKSASRPSTAKVIQKIFRSTILL